MSEIWMEVTKDALSLPVAVAATVYELAKIRGTTPNSIRSAICHDRKSGRFPKYVRVEVDDLP